MPYGNMTTELKKKHRNMWVNYILILFFIIVISLTAALRVNVKPVFAGEKKFITYELNSYKITDIKSNQPILAVREQDICQIKELGNTKINIIHAETESNDTYVSVPELKSKLIDKYKDIENAPADINEIIKIEVKEQSNGADKLIIMSPQEYAYKIKDRGANRDNCPSGEIPKTSTNINTNTNISTNTDTNTNTNSKTQGISGDIIQLLVISIFYLVIVLILNKTLGKKFNKQDCTKDNNINTEVDVEDGNDYSKEAYKIEVAQAIYYFKIFIIVFVLQKIFARILIWYNYM